MFSFKKILTGSAALLGMLWFTGGCAPSGEAVQQQNANRLQQYRQYASANDTTDGNNEIQLEYANQSSAIQINLDPDKDQFFLDLSGMTPVEKDTVFVADTTLMQQREDDIRTVLSKFRQAQDLFYLEEYTEALRLLNETLEIAETADAYALKGTIHFMRGNQSATRENWNRAVELNPDLPIPSIPELEDIIEDILDEEENQQAPQENEDEDNETE
mgnify:CR=1 FL=1